MQQKSPEGQTTMRCTDALVYVERNLALARDYQSASIVKATIEYVRSLEAELEAVKAEIAEVKATVEDLASENKVECDRAESDAARELRLSAESA